MTKKKPDEIDAEDELNRHLNAAMGIVHAVSLATLRPNDMHDKSLHHALESAFDHLEEAKAAG